MATRCDIRFDAGPIARKRRASTTQLHPCIEAPNVSRVVSPSSVIEGAWFATERRIGGRSIV